ncbi:putative holin [Ottowia pentelensis]
MADWVVAALLLSALVWLMAPQQIPVSVYKLSLVALAAVCGWWIDRSLFPYARPEFYLEPPPEMGEARAETAFTDVHVLSFAEPVGGLLPEHAALLGRAAMLRRAIIVAATMLAVGLGA